MWRIYDAACRKVLRRWPKRVERPLQLSEKTAAAIVQPHAVFGLGGVGKTQLASEYAWQYRTNYDAVFWIDGNDPASIQTNIANLSSATVLDLPEANVPEQEARFIAVVRWLAANNAWLLVVDRVDTEEAIDFLRSKLPAGLPGHLVCTSRRSIWPIGFKALEIDTLSEDAAIKFLEHRTQRGGDPDVANVARALHGLPLALEQAGAYIIKYRISFGDYLKLFDESHSKALGFRAEGGTGYKSSVSLTWQVAKPSLSPTAIILLRLLSCFAPAPDDLRYSADKTAIVRCAAVLARSISRMKFEPGEKSHACMTTLYPAASSSHAIHSAHGLSTPV